MLKIPVTLQSKNLKKVDIFVIFENFSKQNIINEQKLLYVIDIDHIYVYCISAIHMLADFIKKKIDFWSKRRNLLLKFDKTLRNFHLMLLIFT